MRRISLRFQILLLIAGTVMGLAALILGVIAAVIGWEIDRAVHSDVQAAGGVLSQFMRERSAALKGQSLTFARQPVFKAYLGVSDPAVNPGGARPDAATIRDSLNEYLQEMHMDAALLTDRDGVALAETDAAGAAPADHNREAADHNREPGVAAALQGETWSGVMARNECLMLAVSVPVTIHTEVWGTFTAYSRIDANVARDLKTALGSDVAFVYKGRTVGASRAVPARLPTPRSTPQLVTVGGVRYFALYAPLPDAPPSAGMGFVTLRPYDRAMALYNHFQMLLIGVSVLALPLALIAGAGVAQGITRPLDGVVAAARKLREGEWPNPFTVRRTDEIGLLQTVFNEMTVAMRAGQERLLALIDIDPLTELDNHRRFHERLQQETKRCAASGEALSLLFLDLDHFQKFNQKYGHAAGDRALQQVALLLRSRLPEVAILARYGGEEFTVLLPRHDLNRAAQSAEEIRRVAAGQDGADPLGEGLTLSVGCAEFGTHSAQADGLVMAAELAASRAKQLGRNRVCCFESTVGGDENADPYQLHRFLKDGSLATIQALAAAVDAKDPYTQGHSQRVAEYASALARYIGLSENEVELIYTTGTLHDVGKIGVPDAILKKPGRLDDEERAVMETHPVLGEVIVRKAPQLAITLPGVRGHHERWDGKGYPDRLAGEAIPQMARILAVADTYDAMTSDRPYRKGLSAEIALAEIAKGAGAQFDPVLARAYVEMMSPQTAQARAA